MSETWAGKVDSLAMNHPVAETELLGFSLKIATSKGHISGPLW